MGIMEGKVCIVTGGGGSLGRESARLMLKEGARVMLVDRDQQNLAKSVRDLQKESEAVSSVNADVSDAQQTKNYIERTLQKWGKIDVLFSNAGISGMIKPITDFPEEVFDAVMAVNVRASFLACKYGLPHMNDGGSIILNSSVVGVTADPGICAYATSKHALIGLMRTVAKEVAGRRIRVNAVCPGPIDNEFQSNVEVGLSAALGTDATKFLDSVTPLGRHGKAEEIARMVLFLASDQSSYSTGSVFMADGGMSI
ncbi:MAG: short-chain dehydrogenase [Deltaproteobacteria bacterium HGW-Deltaproteobacteria-21]|nr:MAG: short-chain dehydrogenase [Deltaproteobacteria bacterium HGW-Deltaproteobacteria-21]